MIVNSERAIALTCPACQVFQEHPFSLFRLSGQPLQLLCKCGFSQGHFRKLKKNYVLDVLGADGDRVRMLFSKQELLHSHLISVLSPKNGQKLGYLGSLEIVKRAVLTETRVFLPELGDFSNARIMHEILAMLQDLAEAQKIKCGCERPSIGLDIYSDKVELVCSFCGSAMLISASTREHREKLSQVGEITMKPCSSQFLEEWLKFQI